MMLIDYLDRGAIVNPDGTCMVTHDGSVRYTHAQVRALSHRVAAALRAGGVREGDRVGIYSPNDPLAFACLMGTLRAGATWVAINAKSSTGELTGLLDMLECNVLIYHSALADSASELIDSVDSIRTAVSIGAGRDGDPELSDWMAPDGTEVEPASFDPERIAMLMGTGGTTGRSKGVPITNRQLHLMCMAFNAHMPEPDPGVYLLATPMTHAAGGAAFPVVAQGGTVVVHDGVVPKDIFASIERHRVTRIFLPPTALYALLGRPDARAHDYSSLRYFLVAAAPIAPDRLAEAVDVFGPVMTQVFGQAEAPFICTFLSPAEIALAAADPSKRHLLASCGRPSLIASVAIMDDDGNLLPRGQAGEIVVRSDLVMRGYYKNPEATAKTRRPGGWHGTGDVGVMDADGYLSIVDRKKDMIITGGFNVFPSEVENVIHSFEAVNDCAVIGLPDEKWGEAVTAVVELKDGADLDTDALIKEIRARLGAVKTPKSVILRELPRSPVGKVLKRKLRDEYWAGRQRMV